MTFSLSGFLYDKDGHIVTIAYAVAGASDVFVEDESGNRLKAKVVGMNEQDNIALLKVDLKDTSLTPAEFAEKIPEVGDEIMVVSSPLGLKNTVVFGTISGRDRTLVGSGRIYSGMLQLAVPSFQTDPGGIVTDMNGKTIGLIAPAYLKPPVVAQTEELLQSIAKNLLDLRGFFEAFMKDKDEETRKILEELQREASKLLFPEKLLEPLMGSSGITFAIPADSLKKSVVALLKQKKPAWLGVSLRSMSEDELSQLPAGLVVMHVAKDSPAEKGGIQAFDVIVSLNKREIKDVPSFKEAIENLEPGTTVEIVIFRKGEKKTLSLTLGSR
jgi:S1-C subfamily serine protease